MVPLLELSTPLGGAHINSGNGTSKSDQKLFIPKEVEERGGHHLTDRFVAIPSSPFTLHQLGFPRLPKLQGPSIRSHFVSESQIHLIFFRSSNCA